MSKDGSSKNVIKQIKQTCLCPAGRMEKNTKHNLTSSSKGENFSCINFEENLSCRGIIQGLKTCE
jgi:hypothetical protein